MTPEANIVADLLPLSMEEFDEDEDEDEDEDDFDEDEARVYEYELSHIIDEPEQYNYYYNYYNYYIQELDTDDEDEPLDNGFHFSFWAFLLMLFRAIFQ